MQTRMRTAIILLTITGLTGIWLVLAPLIASYQPIGDPWITATTHHIATGTVLAVISLAAVLTIIGGALRSLDGTVDTTAAATDPSHRRSRQQQAHEEGDGWNHG